ncbi:MAG: 4-hydroxy-tetrahydrodipicolinate reductase [Kiritimatiellia bacterium]|jgi:4-hydroxy-tetrahydrodipicolinate reductase
MITIAIMGAGGRMGVSLVQNIRNFQNLQLAAAVEQAGHPMVGVDSGTVAGCAPNGVPVTDDLAAAVARADVVVDFTFHEAVPAVAEQVRRHRKAYVLGTTGLTAEELAGVKAAAEVAPVLMAPNMSLGVNLLLTLVKQAAAVLGVDYDAEIVEMHHRHKKDAPSGTALALAKAVAAGRGVAFGDVARHGREGIVGERKAGEIAVHAVRGGDVVGDHVVMFATDGERVELTHKASSRGAFSSGALRAAEWLVKQKPGFHEISEMLGL